jgi:hypothetical protein
MAKVFFKAMLVPMLLAAVVALTASSGPAHPQVGTASLVTSVQASSGPLDAVMGNRLMASLTGIPEGESVFLVGSGLLVLGTVLRRKVNRRPN